MLTSLSQDIHILNIILYTSNIHIFTCQLYFIKAWEKIKFKKRSNGDTTGTHWHWPCADNRGRWRGILALGSRRRHRGLVREEGHSCRDVGGGEGRPWSRAREMLSVDN